MKKNHFKAIKLAKGEINRYRLRLVTLYAYKTNDPVNDMTLVLEKQKRCVVLEPPCFTENLIELEQYLAALGLTVEGLLIAYHTAGANFIKMAKRYSTRNAEDYGVRGPGRSVANAFAQTFGSAFDGSINAVTDYIEQDSVAIAGIAMNIERTEEAFNVEIPEINAKYMHTLSHKVHAIINDLSHIEAELNALYGCLNKGYDLILSAHCPPEDLRDVKTKIAYLRRLQSAAAAAASAEQFKGIIKHEYPDYSGEQYLEMTAQSLFGIYR